MDRKSKVLLTSLLILLIMSVITTYYKFVIKKDLKITSSE
ncbi:MAG: hypothetical protein JWN89_141 [Parcubacteria group bacterium]|nr:hypothetical protein [Parcubacteria group bacterium]